MQPIYYSGNHGVSSEHLSFVFCPAIMSFVQFEIIMTYSIFATKLDIHAAAFVGGCVHLIKEFRKNNIVQKTCNQTFDETYQYKN